MDKRVAETYARDSKAQNKNALRDPYIKAIRWASDRIGSEGIVALVTNSGFVDSIGADGMRLHLANQFDAIYILDLGGNVLRNPKLSGTTHNVFGIQRGVSINLLVRRPVKAGQTRVIRYARADEYWRKEQKYQYLEQKESAASVAWQALVPDAKNNWLTVGLLQEFEDFPSVSSIFSLASNGLKTNRDEWAYNFDRGILTANINRTLEVYNQEVARWASRRDKKVTLDDFLVGDQRQISWSETLKKHVQAGDYASFDETKVRRVLYRPFCSQHVYFDTLLNERQYQLRSVFPQPVKDENQALWCKVGSDWPFFSLTVNTIPDALPQSGSRCFPFYTYAEEGTHRRENITDWALEQFRAHYHDPSITKWDIFHYIYAVLHHPEYRERYAANLRRELPRIPFASVTTACHPDEAESSASPRTPEEGPMHLARTTTAADNSTGPPVRKNRGPQDYSTVFHAFAKAGQRMAEIHVHYEQQPQFKLTKVEKKSEKLDYCVTKMKLSKDKTTLIYNQFLTLSGIPKETYDYRLGNRSALEWVIDQYQVSTDKRSGITNDPNRADDPQYILRLIGQVITVSLETVSTVRALPPLGLPG